MKIYPKYRRAISFPAGRPHETQSTLQVRKCFKWVRLNEVEPSERDTFDSAIRARIALEDYCNKRGKRLVQYERKDVKFKGKEPRIDDRQMYVMGYTYYDEE